MNGASSSAFLPISTRFTSPRASPRARTGSGVHHKCARRVNNPPGAYAIRHGQYAISYRQLPPPQPPPPPHELLPPPHELPPPQEWWPPPWWPPPPPSPEPESPAHQLIPPPASAPATPEPRERRRRWPRPVFHTTRTSSAIAPKTSRMMKASIVPTPVFLAFRCSTVMPPPSGAESKVEEVQRFPGMRRPLVCVGSRTRGQGWTTGPSRGRDLQRAAAQGLGQRLAGTARSAQAKPSRRGPGRPGRSYSAALHLDARNHARSTVCGSTAYGMGAGESGG